MLMAINDLLPELADDSSKPQVLTEEEFQRLCEKIKSLKQRDYSCFRDYLVIEIMYQTARPLSDILALQKENIDLVNECVMFSNKSIATVLSSFPAKIVASVTLFRKAK